MMTLMIISIALFLIGIIPITCDIEWLRVVGILLVLVGGLGTVGFGIRANQTKSIKEFSASEYTLSYKITEFEDQRDTTYILIPKGE